MCGAPDSPDLISEKPAAQSRALVVPAGLTVVVVWTSIGVEPRSLWLLTLVVVGRCGSCQTTNESVAVCPRTSMASVRSLACL